MESGSASARSDRLGDDCDAPISSKSFRQHSTRVGIRFKGDHSHPIAKCLPCDIANVRSEINEKPVLGNVLHHLMEIVFPQA